MKTLLLVVVAAGLLVRGTAPSAEELTPDEAKAALLAMMQSPEGRAVDCFSDGQAAEALAARPVERDEQGGYAWGPFSIHLRRRHYNLLLMPQPESGACTFEFEGTFAWRDQRWTASVPRMIAIMTPAH